MLVTEVTEHCHKQMKDLKIFLNKMSRYCLTSAQWESSQKENKWVGDGIVSILGELTLKCKYSLRSISESA